MSNYLCRSQGAIVGLGYATVWPMDINCHQPVKPWTLKMIYVIYPYLLAWCHWCHSTWLKYATHQTTKFSFRNIKLRTRTGLRLKIILTVGIGSDFQPISVWNNFNLHPSKIQLPWLIFYKWMHPKIYMQRICQNLEIRTTSTQFQDKNTISSCGHRKIFPQKSQKNLPKNPSSTFPNWCVSFSKQQGWVECSTRGQGNGRDYCCVLQVTWRFSSDSSWSS